MNTSSQGVNNFRMLGFTLYKHDFINQVDKNYVTKWHIRLNKINKKKLMKTV